MLRVFGLVVFGAMSLAAADNEGRTCNNASLRGDYAFILTGTKPSGPPPAALEQMLGLTRSRFDGFGGRTGTDTIHASVTGVSTVSGTGTYTVNEDCTGTMTLFNPGAPPLEMKLVIVEKGQTVWIVITSPSTVMVSGTGKRI